MTQSQAQHSPRVHGGCSRAVRLALAFFLLLLAAAAVPASSHAQANCAPKPGGPNPGAVAQYCPKEVKKAGTEAGVDDPAGAASGAGGTPTSAKRSPAPPEDRSQIPFSDYPSDAGVSAMIWILLLLLALIMGRWLYRRYGRGSGSNGIQRAWSRISSRRAG